MIDRAAAGLWEFSLAFYAQPGVEKALLSLQDDRGADICFLLAMLWLDARHLALCAEGHAVLHRGILNWQQRYTARFRNLRRRCKKLPAHSATASSEPFYTVLKAVELQSERVVLCWLEEAIGKLLKAGELVDSSGDTGVSNCNVRKYMEELGIDSGPIIALQPELPGR